MQTMTCECAKCRAGGSTGLEAFESANFAFEEEGTFGAFEHDELTEEFDELADEAEFANEDELVDEDELPRRGGGAARSGAHPTRPKRRPAGSSRSGRRTS